MVKCHVGKPDVRNRERNPTGKNSELKYNTVWGNQEREPDPEGV